METRSRARSAEAKQKKRAMLLTTATHLLKTMPYHTIKMQDIAKAAGVSKGTLFVYFESKDLLFNEVLNEAIKHHHHHLLQGLKSLRRSKQFEVIDFLLEELAGLMENDQIYISLLATQRLSALGTQAPIKPASVTLVGRELALQMDLPSEIHGLEILEALEAIMIGFYGDGTKAIDACRYYLHGFLTQ